MKFTFGKVVLLALFFLAINARSQQTSQIYCDKISSDSIKKYLYVLASDSLEGRETGRPGQKKASYFLASKYFLWNLSPANNAGSINDTTPSDDKKNTGRTYFQDHPISVKNNSTKNFLINDEPFLYGKDFYYPDNYIDTIIAPDKFTFIFTGHKKKLNASEIVNSKKYFDKNLVLFDLNDTNSAAKITLNNPDNSPKGAPVIVLIVTSEKNIQKHFSEREARMWSAKPVQILISEKIASKFFSPKIYTKFLNRAKRSGKSSTKNTSAKTSLELVKHTNQLRGQNILAFIPGSDRSNETVVISSHYDHLGKKDTLIYHGADDNASGTSAVLELARVFKEAAKDGHGPRRNILFLNVSGEEKRLLGSSWYVSNPAFPLENTIVDLNIDMIGRTDPLHDSLGVKNYIYIIGSDKISKQLHEINEEQNKNVTMLDLNYKYNSEDDPNQFYRRSDHYNFVKNGIPVIFYFNGVHADYHKPTDTADKIDFELLSHRAKLVFLTAWEVANRDNRLVIDKVNTDKSK